MRFLPVTAWKKRKGKTPEEAAANPPAWHDSYIQKILHNDAVIGTMHPHTTRLVNGKRVAVGPAVENYYPAAVTDLETWKAVQALAKSSPGRQASTTKNLFSGLLKDGVHGAPMLFVDKGDADESRNRRWNKRGKTPPKRKREQTTERWQYLVSDRRRTHPDETSMRWKYNDFENLFLRAMLDYDWQQQKGRDPIIVELESRISNAERKVVELKAQGKNLAKAIACGADATFIKEEMREVEQATATTQKDLDDARNALKTRRAAQQAFQPIEDAEDIYANRDQEETRLRLRLEIRQRVTRIDLYPDGTTEAKHQPDLPEPHDLYCQMTKCFKATLANDVQVWAITYPDKITVIEMPPEGHAPTFWQTTRKELRGWEFWRGLTNQGVAELTPAKRP
jgi:hypothetical protein